MAGLLPGASAATPVLELRIHGVNDTPPGPMLELPAGAVVEVAGDDLGGFWLPTAQGQQGLVPSDPGLVPAGIRREAYSWGGLARSSIAFSVGPAAVGRAVAVVGRLGWTLLIPLSMANMAYWARRPRSDGGAFEPGPGAGLIRLLGLLLTLLVTVTSCTVALDLVGTQCFLGGRQVCSSVPTQLDALGHLTEDRRLALLSLVPLLLLAFLCVLTARTRVRFADSRGAGGRFVPDARQTPPSWPLLSSAGFWNAGEVLSTTARLHLAGAAMLVVGLTAGQGAVVVGGPHLGGGRAGLELGLLLAAGVVGLLVAVLVVRTADGAPDIPAGRDPRWFTAAAGSAAVVLLSAQEVVLVGWSRSPTDGRPLRGLGVATAVLIAALLAAALAALSLRRLTRDGVPPRRGLRYGLPALALAAVVVATVDPLPSAVRIAATVLAPAAALGSAAYGRYGGAQRREYEAWHGQGAGVFALLGAFLAMLLSSALVLAVGNVLDGALPPSSLAPGSTCAGAYGPGGRLCPAGAAGEPHLLVPGTYLSVASTVLLVVVVLAATLAVGWVSSCRLPPVEPGPVDRARRFAAFTQRAEVYVGVLAGVGGVALTVSVAAGVLGHDLDGFRPVIRALTAVGVWALLLVGGAVITLAAGGGGKRPFGLVWDLVCVLPRTAHPFGPPCYAERAVPEIQARVEDWLDPPSDPAGRTVLSAHSLGGVLAAAVVLGLDPGRLPRVSLLTYGVQLRAYFGRIFPELLGPQVVGGSECGRPLLRTPDPWAGQLRGPQPPDHPGAPLRTRLGGDGSGSGSGSGSGTGPGAPARWRNLWRRTDYIGFPAIGYGLNPVDHLAAEVDTTRYLPTVATHGDYPRVPEYAGELADLDGLPPSTPPD